MRVFPIIYTGVIWMLCLSLLAGCGSSPTPQGGSPPPASGKTGEAPSPTLTPAAAYTETAGTASPTTPILETAGASNATPTAYPVPALKIDVILNAVPSPGSPVTFTDVFMNTPGQGWGLETNGHVMHTVNGGTSWKNVTPAYGFFAAGGFFALDGNTAWAAREIPLQCGLLSGVANCPSDEYNRVKEGIVWRSTDGGRNWTPSRPFLLGAESSPDMPGGRFPFAPISLQFVDADTGFLLVEVRLTEMRVQSSLYRTDDGGGTWIFVTDFGQSASLSVCTNIGAAFADRGTGWLVARCPTFTDNPMETMMIYKTGDGGRSWKFLNPPTATPEGSPAPPPETSSAGSDPLAVYRVQRYPDGSMGVHRNGAFYWINYEDARSRCWATAEKILPVYPGNPARAHSYEGITSAESEYFLNQESGWRLRWNYASETGEIQQTGDGGKNWQPLYTAAWRWAHFNFVDALNGWAVVTTEFQETALFRTTDAGRNWEMLEAVVTP